MRKQTTATILARAEAEYGHRAVPPSLWRNCVGMVVAATGSQDAALLDHREVADAILLCEALNWAAKYWHAVAYDYKEEIVRYTVDLMEETGEGTASRRSDVQEEFGTTWTDWVVVLQHPEVGEVGFHGLSRDWVLWTLPETSVPWSGYVRQYRAFDSVAAWVRGNEEYFAQMLFEEEAALQKTLRLEVARAARDRAANDAYEMAASSDAVTPAAQQAVVQRAWARVLELKEEFPEIEDEEGMYGWFACQLDEPAVQAAVAARARGESIPRRDYYSWLAGRYVNWDSGVTARTPSNGFEEESVVPRQRLTADETRRRRFYFPEWGTPESGAPIPVGSRSRFRSIEPADAPAPPTAEPPPRSRRFQGIEFAD